jgi:hypothetical protein
MSKLLAIVYFILFTILFLFAKPVSCFAEAAVQSRFLDFKFFVEVFLEEWNDPQEIKLADAWEIVKETWNFESYK